MKSLLPFLLSFFLASHASSAELQVDDPAPLFKVKNQSGASFDLAQRKGQWTVLYFYPKASTPGCTKQACAFRDEINKIRTQGAEVYGISADEPAALASFHREEKLTFDLLSDPDARVINMFGAAMDGKKVARRWTFIIDPELKIKKIAKDVDPLIDSQMMAADIAGLKLKGKKN